MERNALRGALPLVLASLLAPVSARPQVYGDVVDDGEATSEQAGEPVAEPTPPPYPPPAPAVAAPAPPTGQWVNTWQYGWVWMPYGASYTYQPADGSPLMYVYGPSFGWTWVGAPWVWGWGPWPYFGFHGAVYYSWYGRGPWHSPGWHAHPWPARGPGWSRPPPVRVGGVLHAGIRGTPSFGGRIGGGMAPRGGHHGGR